MGLEAATFIHQLNAANPVGASDPKGQGDDHIRMMKAALQATFPAIAGAMTLTHTQLNNAAIKTEANVFTAVQEINPGGTARLRFTDTAAAVNEKIWDVRNELGNFVIQARTDAAASPVDFLNCDRIGTGSMSAVWQGVHSYTNNGGGSQAAIRLNSNQPTLRFTDADAAVDEKEYDITCASSSIQLRFRNDAFSSTTTIWQANRGVGTAITSFDVVNGQLKNAGVDVPNLGYAATWTSSHVFTAGLAITIQNAAPQMAFVESGVTANNTRWDWIADGEQFRGRLVNDANNAFQNWITVDRTNNVVDAIAMPQGNLSVTAGSITAGTTISDAGGNVRDIPRLASGSAFTQGRMLAQNAGITINTSDLAAGRAYSIYNDSGAAITLTQGAGVTLRLAGTATTGNRTIAARGICSLWCNSGTEVIASGNVT